MSEHPLEGQRVQFMGFDRGELLTGTFGRIANGNFVVEGGPNDGEIYADISLDDFDLRASMPTCEG